MDLHAQYISGFPVINNKYHKTNTRENLLSMNKVIMYMMVGCALPVYSAAEPSEQACIFFHGLGGDSSHMDLYTQEGILPKNCQCFDSPEVTNGGFRAAVFAQQPAVDAAIAKIKTIPTKKLYGYGISQGGGSIITTAADLAEQQATHNIHNPDMPKRFEAIVCEAPFADPHVVFYEHQHATPLRYICGGSTLLRGITKCIFPKYNPYSRTPIQKVSSIDKETAILFVAAENDQLIRCYSNTLALYMKLKKEGRNNVYLCTTPTGDHILPGATFSSPTAREVISAFYNRYGFNTGYNFPPEILNEKDGNGNLKYQPSIEDVSKKVRALRGTLFPALEFTGRLLTGSYIAYRMARAMSPHIISLAQRIIRSR